MRQDGRAALPRAGYLADRGPDCPTASPRPAVLKDATDSLHCRQLRLPVRPDLLARRDGHDEDDGEPLGAKVRQRLVDRRLNGDQARNGVVVKLSGELGAGADHVHLHVGRRHGVPVSV